MLLGEETLLFAKNNLLFPLLRKNVILNFSVHYWGEENTWYVQRSREKHLVLQKAITRSTFHVYNYLKRKVKSSQVCQE